MTNDKPTYQDLEQRISLLEQELRDQEEKLSLLQKKAHERERDIQHITSNFETFFDTNDDFLFVIDEQGNILHCNKTVEKRLGYTADELKGKSILSVHPEEHRSEAAQLVADMIIGKIAFCQIPLITKQGKQIFVETRVNNGAWNGIPAFFGVSKDITKLKLSEEKFATLFRSSPDTIMLSRLSDGVIADVNDSACINLGYTKEELIGKTTLQLNIWVNPEDRKQYVELLTKNHRANNFEAKFRMKSGQIKVGLMSSEIIQLFNDFYHLGITRDITDRKKAEEEIIKKNTEYYTLNAELAESLERIQRINTQLEKAKEIAEENEKKFSIAFHSSPSVSMITNVDTGEIIEANDAVEQFAGFSRAETIGNSVIDLNFWMIEGARDKFIEILRQDKKVLNLESTFRKKSGEAFTGLISGQMIQIQNQNCLLSIIHDITDRKNTEIELLKAKEKVEESEEKFKNLYESLSISYLTLKDGVCIECNEATLSIYGVASKDEIIGKSPINFSPEFQFNHEKSSKEAKRHNQTAIEEGFHTFEWLAQRKNKEEFYAEVSLKRYYYKNELYIQCLTTDITERKRIENELIAAKEHSAEKESFLRTLINNLPDLVWLKDVNGAFLTCNKRLEELFGGTGHEIIGKTDYDFVSANLADSFHQSDIEAINSGKPIINEELISIANNNHSEYLETIKTPFYRNGELVGVLGIGRIITERKNAELELLKAKEKIEESEEKFKNLYESLSISYLILKDGVCIECNEATLSIYGIDSKEEILGKAPSGFSPEFQPNHVKSSEEAERHIQTAIEKGFHSFEWVTMRKNKQKFYSEVSLKRFYHKNELYIQCLVADISERKKNEAELIAAKEDSAENELFLSTLINTLPDLVWLKDINGVYLKCNKRFEEFLGAPEQEIIGKTDYDFMNPDLVDFFRNKDIEAIDAGKSLINEELITFTSDNHSEYVETIKTPFYRNGQLVGVLGISRNITKRKNAELELLKAKEKVEESEEKFKNLYESLSIAYLIIKNGVCVECNKAALDIYGIESKEEIIGKSPIDYSPEYQHNNIKSSEEARRHTLIALEKGFHTFEWLAMRKNRELFYNEVSLKKFYYKNELYLQCLTTDITERKKIELELIAAKEKAEESDRLKTAFLQNMSHEIRTPLNAISGFSELLEEPDLPQETRKGYFQIIQNNTNQLISIVSDILTISSLETKQVNPNISNVCINNVISELLAIFKQQALLQNISLLAKQQLNDQQSVIETDKTKITQILSNLLSNALKFTHKGFIQFGYNLKGNELEFFIKDSGIGIKQEFHDKIFERFRQGDKSINKLYGGTGLGLAISKAFVELLGGKIWVQSEVGKGSTFYFTLPYKPANKTDKTTLPC